MSVSNKDQQQIVLSAEKHFIHYDSFNKGFVQVPRMVKKCIGLSLQAKGVYDYIATFVYEHGRSAFPSIHNIAVGCGISASSAVKYIDELVRKGFIKRVRRGRGMTNDYYIVDVDQVDLLRVSEMMWEGFSYLLNESKGRRWEQLEEAMKIVTAQIKSEGYEIYQLEATEEFKEAFLHNLKSAMEGEKLEPMAFIPKKPKSVTATAQPSAPQERTVLGKNSVPYMDRDEDTWNVTNFVDFFYKKFLEATGQKHSGSLGMHQGIMKRSLKQMEGESKHELRRYINAFFEMGYDIKTIEWFGRNGRVGEVRQYLSDGTKPFYLTDKYKNESSQKVDVENATQERTGLSLEALDRLLGGEQNE